jgi:hypothetical protein
MELLGAFNTVNWPRGFWCAFWNPRWGPLQFV